MDFLSHYRILKIIKEAGKKNNTYLDLSCQDMIKVPNEIGLLTNLKGLNLSGNLLIYIPESIGLLTKLNRLYLYDNCLEILPESIKQLVNLGKLIIDTNPIEVNHQKQIKKWLPKNCNIYF